MENKINFDTNSQDQIKLTENDQQFNVKPKKINKWYFWLPLFFQLGLIAFLPATAINVYLTGKTVILQTAPVDPYSLLTGYYQVLNYEISAPNNLKNLTGWQELKEQSCRQNKNCSNYQLSLPQGTKFYLILKAPENQNKTRNSQSKPIAWQPVRVSAGYPQNLTGDEITIQGQYKHGDIIYGLESYYMPENQKDLVNQEINNTIRNSNNNERQNIPFLVEIKVNSQGKAIPISLWINDKSYRF